MVLELGKGEMDVQTDTQDAHGCRSWIFYQNIILRILIIACLVLMILIPCWFQTDTNCITASEPNMAFCCRTSIEMSTDGDRRAKMAENGKQSRGLGTA